MFKKVAFLVLLIGLVGIPVFAGVDSNEMMSAVQNSASTIKPVLMIIFVIVELGILFGGGITALIFFHLPILCVHYFQASPVFSMTNITKINLVL